MIPKANASLYVWADFYRSQGFSVIPLREGKLPGIRWKEHQTRVAARGELSSWFTGKEPFWGIALVCGAVSGNLARIDFDDAQDYENAKPTLDKLSKLSALPVFRSQREGGGFGVLFRSTEPVPTLPQKSFPKCLATEVRGEGSITVIPPTPGYGWLKPPPKELPVISGAALLKELFGFDLSNQRRMIESVDRSAGGELATLLTDTTEGERNANIVRIGSMLRSRGIDQDTARAVVLRAFEEHWPQDGMDVDEVRETFDTAWRRYEHEGIRVTGMEQPMSLGKLDEDDDKPRVKVMGFDEIKPLTEKSILIPNVVLAGVNGNTLVAAPTKIGKTSLFQDAAITASRGDLVWGFYPVPKPLRIAIIDQELKFEQMKSNQVLMEPVIGAPDNDNLKLIVEESGQFDIQHPAALDQLYRELYAFEPDLVILDGWGWFVGHQASDPKLVKPALTWLKRLRSSLGCATIIIHHFKKEQFSGRVIDHNSFVDQLDKIEGLKRLADQSHTVLGYTPITGYDTFNLLDGRSNNPKWDPPKTIIDYDHLSVTHMVVSAQDGMELFDPETYKFLWARSTESKALKSKLQYIMNRRKVDRAGLAEMLGVDKSMVSRWYSGQRSPSAANEAQIDDLYAQARQALKARNMPKGKDAA